MYYEKLSKKPLKDKIDNGTYLIGVQVNEEGEEVVSKYSAEAIEAFKNKKAEEAKESAEAAQKKAEAAKDAAEAARKKAENAQNRIEQIQTSLVVANGALCVVFEEV